MAFPFVQAPTVEEFVTRLTDRFGCVLKTLPGDLAGPKGVTKIRYLEKNGWTSEPLPVDLQERISPDTASRFIRQLHVSKDAWLWAGDPYNPDD